ncbi:interleukin-2 receptor subunit beta [Thunnus albacares]|uniref:interleukin-2 receptor subunit beta n=1 Tax=Thunnus albacares TaxID=8236 RepID=UPI001CF7116E|nr:interleukin-2 receptor subunit beta [Thunnus albacares]
MSHIVVMAMKILWSLYVPVVLFSLHAAHSHKDSQGLSCVNDFVDNVSCTWNGSLTGPGVDCWIFGWQKTWIFVENEIQTTAIMQNCKLKQYKDSLPGCSFVFEKKFSCADVLPNITMKCNGTLVGKLTNYEPCYHIKMHPPSAPNVNRTDDEILISWNQGSPPSNFLKIFNFEVQIKQNHQTWQEARIFPTEDQKCRIPASQLKEIFPLWETLQIRVRVQPTDRPNSSWSNWSPTTECQGQVSESWLMQFVMVSLALVIVVMVLLYWRCVSRGLLASKPVPNPSKYFHTLHSVHGGNLKKWLNPLSVSESFFTAQPCDHISPVEVCESWDVVRSTSPSSSSTTALLYFRSYPSAGSDTSGVVDNSSSSISSGFSNMGYFMSSSSSSSARTHPSPAYFTYKEDFCNLQNSHNLHLSLCPSLTTCESLKMEPQSPDSGFGIEEDEEDKEDKRDVVGEEVSDDHQSTPILILPLHLPSRMCPSSIPPPPLHPPSLTQISSDSQQVDATVADASGSYAAWPVAGSMYRSSSMPVEPCKTGYLTLKELQTTFSNKSI